MPARRKRTRAFRRARWAANSFCAALAPRLDQQARFKRERSTDNTVMPYEADTMMGGLRKDANFAGKG